MIFNANGILLVLLNLDFDWGGFLDAKLASLSGLQHGYVSSFNFASDFLVLINRWRSTQDIFGVLS